jgi:hypothetical protein
MDSPEHTSPGQAVPPGSDQQMKRPSVAPKSYIQRIFLRIVLFIAGVVVGIVGLSSAVLLFNADRPPVAVPASPHNPALVAQASATYVNQVVQQNSGSFGVPGTLKNLQVSFVHDGPVTVTGEDEVSVLGLSLTRRFSLNVQLYTDSCKPMVHVLSANFSGIPITGFVATFEQNINQQLQHTISGLPPGFTYCVTGIHTETQGASVTFSAQPIA